jgi:PAS domain S-box-containing protein
MQGRVGVSTIGHGSVLRLIAGSGEAEFQHLLDTLPAGAYTCDADGLITYFNEQAASIWGRAPKLNDPADRFSGSLKLLDADGEPIRHDECWMALALRENAPFNGQEIVIEQPTGTRLTVLAHANPLHDREGRLVGAVNVLVDISDRRRSQEAVRRAHQTLQTIMRASPLPIVVIDADPPLVRLWNPAASALFGWADDEVIGREAPLVPPGKCDEWAQCRASIARGNVVWGVETQRLTRDGTPIDVSLCAAPLGDGAGAPPQIMLIFSDIRERVRTAKALTEADRTKTEFLATLAHELRNPLAPIRNAVEILHVKGAGDADSAFALDIIERQTRQMARLIDDLLDVARITANKLELRRERTTLRHVLEAAIETARPLIEQGAHELTVSVPDEPIALDVDPTRLAQVVSNLLNNAAKYTPHGGRIRLAAERRHDQLAIAVQDSGIGIAHEFAGAIFEMFTQAHGQRAGGGLGLGLPLAKRLAQMHGGDVSVASSARGEGSEFVVTLPLAAVAGEADAPADADRDVSMPHTSLRVLVVDDNEDAANSIAMLLRTMGSDVKTARDGLEALELADSFSPQVYLLDLGLPLMSGNEVARRIREREGGDAATLIAVTGWGAERDRVETRNAGFDHHLVKPVDPMQLMNLVASLGTTPRPHIQLVERGAE